MSTTGAISKNSNVQSNLGTLAPDAGIRQEQQLLSALGYYHGAANGVPDHALTQAETSFRAQYELTGNAGSTPKEFTAALQDDLRGRQQMARRIGLDMPATGQPSAKMTETLTKFQEANGLEPTGVFDSETQALITKRWTNGHDIRTANAPVAAPAPVVARSVTEGVAAPSRSVTLSLRPGAPVADVSVRQEQQHLRLLGFYEGPVNGQTTDKLSQAEAAYRSRLELVGPAPTTREGLQAELRSEVASFQSMLDRLGYGGPIESAVLRYQRESGLPKSGVLDEATRNAIAAQSTPDVGF